MSGLVVRYYYGFNKKTLYLHRNNANYIYKGFLSDGEGRGEDFFFRLQKAYFQRVKGKVKKASKNSQLKVLNTGIKGLLLHPQQRISSLKDWQVIKRFRIRNHF